MSELLYKRLFEVNLLHDYFLVSADGGSFFEKTKAAKEALLQSKVNHQMYNVSDFFEIEPLIETKKRIGEYKLITKKTALGFIVGIQVVIDTKAGELVYKPRFKIGEDINLSFLVKQQFPFFKSITSVSLRSKLPSIYYFTNKNKEEFTQATNPSFETLPIANKAAPHQDGKTYEMGNLVDFGGEVREALQHTDGTNPNHWQKIEDRRFVSDADRILLPNSFNYSMKKAQNITQIEFVLENEVGTEIKTIRKNEVEPLETIRVDFTKDTAGNVISTGFYVLKIKENAGSEVVHKVYMNSDIYDKNYFGIIDIRLDELNSAFSLLDSDGFLNRSSDAISLKKAHPIFELRFNNRKTYWRYNKEIDFTNVEKNKTQEFLNVLSDVALVSDVPKGLTEVLVPFKKTVPPNPTVELMLPSPKNTSVKVEGEKIFSEIYINKSNRLVESIN